MQEILDEYEEQTIVRWKKKKRKNGKRWKEIRNIRNEGSKKIVDGHTDEPMAEL